MKVVIIDKDIQYSNQIKELIIKYNLNENLVIDTICCDYEDVEIQEVYDLYMIQTCVCCLKNSIQFALENQKKNPDALTIFASDCDNLIYDTQEAHCFYYVRKSNLETDLKKAMDLVNEHFSKQYIIVEENKIKKRVCIDEIYAATIDDHYLNLYTESNEYMIRQKNFEKEYGFVRVNRSTMVNPSYISHRIGNQIYLKNNKYYKVSPVYDKDSVVATMMK